MSQLKRFEKLLCIWVSGSILPYDKDGCFKLIPHLRPILVSLDHDGGAVVDTLGWKPIPQERHILVDTPRADPCHQRNYTFYSLWSHFIDWLEQQGLDSLPSNSKTSFHSFNESSITKVNRGCQWKVKIQLNWVYWSRRKDSVDWIDCNNFYDSWELFYFILRRVDGIENVFCGLVFIAFSSKQDRCCAVPKVEKENR